MAGGDHISVDVNIYTAEGPYYRDDWQSETTSIGSSIYRGLMENGRRYQTLSSKEYLIPSDDQQFDTYEAGHLLVMCAESDQENPLFRSPIKNPKHILDIGTGKGTWAIDVADMFPDAMVRGVDLFPPPVAWMPPNCLLEVDDILQEWNWKEPFDLIHMRILIGAFDEKEWDRVYKQCYESLQPGGWIEQLEINPCILSDDGSLTADSDSVLNSWGPTMIECGKAAARDCDIVDTMQAKMAKAGFVDFHVKNYKWPIGPWPRDQNFKDIGTVNFQHWMIGMEGWCMWLLTRFGTPEPWTNDEVRVYVAKIRAELKNIRYHLYHKARRVWARKPFDHELTTTVPEVKVKMET